MAITVSEAGVIVSFCTSTNSRGSITFTWGTGTYAQITRTSVDQTPNLLFGVTDPVLMGTISSATSNGSSELTITLSNNIVIAIPETADPETVTG